MSVEIPAEYEGFVAERIAQGPFTTEAEVVTEALRLMRSREERVAALRAELRPALDRLDRGEANSLDEAQLEALFEGIKRAGRARQPEGNG